MCERTNHLSWEDYFMATSILTSQRSKDPVTQVGACIVDKDNLILAVGYNGLPRNCKDNEFPWCKDKQNPYNDKSMYVVHAEANAILNKNSANLQGSRLYTTLFPCNECTKIIIQSGIKEVIYISDKHGGKPSYHASKRMLDAVGITYRRYVPKKKKIVLDFDNFIQDEAIDLRNNRIIEPTRQMHCKRKSEGKTSYTNKVLSNVQLNNNPLIMTMTTTKDLKETCEEQCVF